MKEIEPKRSAASWLAELAKGRYGESLERVELVIKDHLAEMKENIPDIAEGPFYMGVSRLGSSGVTLRFTAK